MARVILGLLTLYLAASIPAPGQAPERERSGIVIIKASYRKAIRRSDLDRSIFDQESQRRNSNSDDRFQRMRQAQRRFPPSTEGYYYSATIKNDSPLTVKALVWDYTIADAGDPKSLTHHRFFSRVDIRPGKHQEVYRFTVTPPTRTVSADSGHSRLVEEVIVQAVQYKDGSVWRLHQQ